MLSSAITVKLAAMAAALGLNTSEWSNPSPAVTTQIQKIEEAMGNITDASKTDTINAEVNDALKAIKDLADQGDKDAQYAIAYITQQTNQQGSAEQVLKYYELAAKQNQLQAMSQLGALYVMGSRDNDKQQEGVKLIEKASEAGNNVARRNLARILTTGIGGKKVDKDAAQKLLETAASTGDGQAAYELAMFFINDGGKEKQNFQTGYKKLNEAAALGNPSALDMLGSLLLNGGKVGDIDIKPDPKAAVEKFKSLADQKNPVGLRHMSEVYFSGIAGEPKDIKKAVQVLSEAAQGRDAVAQFRLGTIYDKGLKSEGSTDKLDVEPNAPLALNLYRAAAQGGVPEASYNVGVFYEEGRTVDRDPQKAFVAYMQAAQANVAMGMLKVGAFYLNGLGTPKDPVSAFAWFARAAAGNIPEAHLNLGIIKEAGLLDPGDTKSPGQSAAQSYSEAADLPTANDQLRMEALFRIGALYFRGLIVAKGDPAKPDFERAYVYIKQAAELDPKNAQIAAVKKEVEAKLTQDQIKKAEATIDTMKKARDGRKQKAEAAAKAAAEGTAAPAAPAAPATR